MTAVGGARAGWMHVSWPLARLTASSTELRVSGWFLGAIRFTPTDVVALEPAGRSVRIVHARSDRPAALMFWHSASGEHLVHRILDAGFVPRGRAQVPRGWSGMPVRWSVVLATVALWNLLFIADGFVVWKEPKPPGPLAALAVALLLAGATVVKGSPTAQAYVMKPGRSVEEIRGLLSLLQLVSGLVLVGLTIFAAVRTAG